MTSLVVHIQWRETKLRISPPVMKQCYWNLAGMLYLVKYIRWYTFWCCYGNMLSSSLLPLQNKILPFCYSTRQNTWSYLRRMPVPPSLGFLFNIFNCIFYPVQLQMVIFDLKEEGTRTKHFAIATSKCVPSGIFLSVQHPCQISIALLHYCFLILCRTTVTCTTDDVISG